MKVHYVMAHPDKNSFNSALLKNAQSIFSDHTITITDLYAESFNPVATVADLSSSISVAVQKEIDHIKNADLIILQFPLWWFSMPAILKGWMDRVFVFGVAYDKTHRFSTGGFAGKKAMIVTTTQGPENTYQHDGVNGPIESVLYPIHHSLHFVGFKTLPPFVGYAVLGNSDAQNQLILNQYEMVLKNMLRDNNE